MLRRRLAGRPYVSIWKIWVPVLLILVTLDVSFDGWFWRIPKVTGANADFGYQFLVDARPLYSAPDDEVRRVVAFGSSVSGSFDPRQVGTLLEVADPETEYEVHRLLLPAAHPTDYVMYFENTELPAPDVVVILFNLVDFLFSGSDRDANPTLRYILPPRALLADRAEHMSLSGKLDLAVASMSELYRYRRPLRSALQDNARAAQRWLRSSATTGAYGILEDGYTNRRFGFPVPEGETFTFRYFVEPEWLMQRGVVRLRCYARGKLVAELRETRSGWHSVDLPLNAGTEHVDVVLDSTWSPRVTGGEDLRLLGVRLPDDLIESLKVGAKTPYFYRPREPADTDTLMRMGGARGEEFLARWTETLEADTRFGHRFRVYRDAKRAVADREFAADAEYTAIAELTRFFTAAGADVLLVNTPESPLMLADYGGSEYYEGYREYFRDIAGHHPGAAFVDLSEILPAEDFNDLHHPNFVGSTKLGPVYADLVRGALGRIPGQNEAR